MKKTKQNLRAALYCRTSSDDTSDPNRGRASIDEQRNECQALARTLKANMAKKHEFIDRDFTGRSYWEGCPVAEHDLATVSYLDEHNVRQSKRHRPGLTRLVKALPHLDVVLCRDVTRLARPVPDSMLGQALRQELQRHGVRIITVMDGELDHTSFAHRIASLVIEATEDHKIRQQVEASKASLKRLRDGGALYHSPYCFGFASIGKQRVAPIPEELKVVRRVYDLALGNETVMGICRTLNAEGIPTKRSTPEKKYTWTYSQVRGILQRPQYAGCHYDTDGELVESRAHKPYAVISRDEFERVRKRMKEHDSYPRTVKATHPLSTLLKCAACGHNLTIYQGADYDTKERVFYYRCNMANYREVEERLACRYSLIRESLTGNPWGVGLLEALMPLCATGMRIEMAESRMDKTMLARRDEIRERVERIKQEELQVYNDALAGLIDETLKASALAERRQQRLATESELKQLQAKLDSLIPSVGDVRKFTRSLTGGGIDLETYRRLIRKAVKEIQVHPYAVDIVLASGDAFTLERVPDRNARLMPRVGVTFTDPHDLTAQIQMCYMYKSALKMDDSREAQEDGRELTVLLDTPHFQVVTLGHNPKPYSRTLKNKRKRVPIDDSPDETKPRKARPKKRKPRKRSKS